jgi:hypothetical protein
VQFVLMVFQGTTPLPGTPAWDEVPDSERRAIYADYAAVNQAEGVTPGLPLGVPAEACTVTVVGGVPHRADGPYAKDPSLAAGGYLVVEAESIDVAIELAARIPAARHGGGVEIRPVGTYW